MYSSTKFQLIWRLQILGPINQSFIYSQKEKAIINKYNEIKLNKTKKTVRNNVAYYLL